MMGDSQKFHRGTPLASRVKRRRWHQYFPILGVIGLVAILIGTASRYHTFVNLGYEITEIRDTNQALKVEQDELRAELARLQRPDRVMREILAMGLQYMPPHRRFTVSVEQKPAESIEQPTAKGEEVLVAFSGNNP